MGKKVLITLFVAVVLSAGGYFTHILMKNHAAPHNKPQQVTRAEKDKTQTNKDAAPAAAKDANQPKDYSQLGYDLMDHDTLGFLKYELPASELLAKLGEPEKKGEAREWGADGRVHQTWYYKTKGIELDMVQGENGAFSVNMITVKSPCSYRTIRGIGIGSTKDDLLAAYQNEINPEESGEDSVVAGTVYGGIIFKIKNDTVSSIFIGAAAE